MAGSDRNVLRRTATKVLSLVLTKREPLPQALASTFRDTRAPERAWLREVIAGVLRWSGRIDLVLEKMSAKTPPKGDLHKYLSLATYQIWESQVPPELVVSETVDVIKKYEGEPQSKFANALLRKIVESKSEWQSQNPPKGTAKKDLAAWWNLPDWLYQILVKTHGDKWTYQFAWASMQRPEFWIRAKKNTQGLEKWTEPGPIPDSHKTLSLEALTEQPGFESGHFFVQDLSSQILVEEVSKIIPKGEILDLCAAPGGKAMGLSWNHFQVIASDFNPKRLSKLQENILRAATNIKVMPYDQALRREDWSAIWVDAPCSGTGTLQKNPEIRHHLTQERLDSLTHLQTELIQTAWSRLKPGGHLIYSVCSVLKEEGAAHLKGLPKPLKEWTFAPHIAPRGEGFFSFIVQK